MLSNVSCARKATSDEEVHAVDSLKLFLFLLFLFLVGLLYGMRLPLCGGKFAKGCCSRKIDLLVSSRGLGRFWYATLLRIGGSF
jgi:hypothetical protein